MTRPGEVVVEREFTEEQIMALVSVLAPPASKMSIDQLIGAGYLKHTGRGTYLLTFPDRTNIQ